MVQKMVIVLSFCLGSSAFAGQAVSSVACTGILLSPIGLQTLAVVSAAKDAGRVANKDDCKSAGSSIAGVTSVFTGDPLIAAFIVGAYAHCACDRVF